MATLPDWLIEKRIAEGDIEIEPYDETNIEPASVDLRLGNSFVETVETGQPVDTRDPSSQTVREFTAKSVTLAPSEEILATTVERVSLPNDLEASVTGRSSVGRLFVEVHKTAGFCDPGFEGQITLEIQNDNPNAVRLYEGQRICQIIFRELAEPAAQPYGHEDSQYQGQTGAEPSGMEF